MDAKLPSEPQRAPVKPVQYQPPRLHRWGSLRELTQGGGGFKHEPATNRDTRF